MKAKLIRSFVRAALLTSGFLFLWSCSTEIISDSDIYVPDNSETSTPGPSLRISVNPDLIGGSTPEESHIGRLTLVFFEGTGKNAVFRGVSEAAPTSESRVYTARYPVSVPRFPAYVVALANLSFTPDVATVGDLLNIMVDDAPGSNTVPMSSVRYYSEGDKSDVFYSELTAANFDEENRTYVEIVLERMVAKATVENKCSDMAPGIKASYKGASVNVYTTFTGWNINATDKRTYAVKNIENGYGFNTLVGEFEQGGFSDVWHEWSDDGSYGVMHWAHSENWRQQTFDVSDADETTVNLCGFEAVNHPFYKETAPGSSYFSETTRHEKVFDEANALPVLCVAATHTIAGINSGTTFYLDGEDIYLSSDYWDYVARNQNVIYYKDRPGEKVSSRDLFELLEDGPVTDDSGYVSWNLVTPKLKNTVSMTGYVTSEGEELTEDMRQQIDERLRLSCGVMEKFLNGRSLYMVPVEHFSRTDSELLPATGSYGMVRNNHYYFEISGVSSFGHGAATDGFKVSTLPETETVGSYYPLGVRVNVMPWVKVSGALEF